MTKFTSVFLGTACAFAFTASAEAKPSVNDIQQCQAVIEFTIERVKSVSKYDETDVKTVTSGLQSYNAFLQERHMNPGLLDFTKGDKAAAKNFQKQIDVYKAQVITALKAKHPQERIFSDQAVAINNCYSAAPMSDDKTEMMRSSLQTIIKLAKQE